MTVRTGIDVVPLDPMLHMDKEEGMTCAFIKKLREYKVMADR